MKTILPGLLLAVLPLLQANAARPLPTRAKARAAATNTFWGKSLAQIPSTVIDKGVLRNIPYLSYRAGDYELNVYGDPAAPAGVEIGIHKDTLRSPTAKKAVVDFLSGLLEDPADKALLATLKMDADKKVRDGLTFEITPPTAEDAYGGWWVSVYDEKALDRSRASEDEMAKITTTRTAVKESKPAAGAMEVEGAKGKWAADDLANARAGSEKVYSPTISKKDGKYVPDRSIDDTGYILFICANSAKHEDMEVIQKACPACKAEDTFFWDSGKSAFIGFKCGELYDNALVKCGVCGAKPRKVRTKHK
ncbi:MAG TPA: hypothetical protein VF950_09820 [Planctomycetota bacterium]